MTKAELRFKYKKLRINLTLDEVILMSTEIASKVAVLDIWTKTYYHVFMPIANHHEVDTFFLVKILQNKYKKVVVSKSNFETLNMSHYLFDDKTIFEVNKFNIQEPVNAISCEIEKIDVVFVPLLAFDKLGNRVGYGKGFYDRFLSKCRPDCVFIGLSFFNAEQTIADVDSTDCKLNYCVSPNQIFYF